MSENNHQIFMTDSKVGSDLVMWLPNGAIIRRELESFIYKELIKRHYQMVYTPIVGRVELYETSGHYPYYKESQFPPMDLGDGEKYLLRPMSCPHHIRIYQYKLRSYRDLPFRIAEFGLVHHYEELNESTSMKSHTQDDAHIFCTENQIANEFRDCVEMTQFILNTFGLKDFHIRLGLGDRTSNKYTGSPAIWDRAEASLLQMCHDVSCIQEPIVEIGKAEFYGPKADFVVNDCAGRKRQVGTIQLDYNLPSKQRFGLEYIGEDNQAHEPVMIHRTLFGSLEQFVAMLIEHFDNVFPLWLAPEQIRILTVNQKCEEYARQVEQRAAKIGLRVHSDYRSIKIETKIYESQMELIPYMFVIGEQEQNADSVVVQDRLQGDLGNMSIDAALAKLQQEINSKTIRQKN
jgi:threonyl-tRNA synthetase